MHALCIIYHISQYSNHYYSKPKFWSYAVTYPLAHVSCSLARITKLEVKAGVSSLSLAREHSHLFVGLNNGKMLIITPPKKKK